MWLYGSGFPKSLDVSKAIDKEAGAEREIVGAGTWAGREGEPSGTEEWRLRKEKPRLETTPATDAARQWSGWGTALKPAVELICLARKPLSEKTVAANVLRWGTGAINIDACRVATDESGSRAGGRRPSTHEGYQRPNATMFQDKTEWSMASTGRWPANVIHDGSPEVLEGFPETGAASGAPRNNSTSLGASGSNVFGKGGAFIGAGHADNGGSAARFFYTAKADAAERIGSKHPTVKPLDLMQYLIRLVTPSNGVVLDPFAGSGTTGEAAWREGFRAILIEREAEYCADIDRRMAHALKGQRERKQAIVTAKNKTEGAGPLFDLAAQEKGD